MAIYSTPFLFVEQLTPAAGPTSSAAVPPGTVWVVRCITFINRLATASVGYVLAINPSAIGFAIAKWNSSGTEDGLTGSIWNGRQVLEPGWYLSAACSGGTIDICISGYTLTGG